MTCIFHCLFSVVLLFNVSACQSKNKVEKAYEKFEEQIVAQAINEPTKSFVKITHMPQKRHQPKKKPKLVPEFKSRGFRWIRIKEYSIDFR